MNRRVMTGEIEFASRDPGCWKVLSSSDMLQGSLLRSLVKLSHLPHKDSLG